ncbi:Trafficking protein particle complex subunit 3 [Hondaea fermentalgiana]|uniref:Trafficking protein particle complex subunit n=1 Tax=Hondaea fermentalgiana TaxID=2315210 RepID=A0A2R5G8A9_9STRA|nr:Trafficking protein particle complex subunit 3 [Hondaea fermentalgiana]|eukprot:GBG23924.1 Trafficking protein particle complex subunit 3 [Hondaea fermentalgiana]
MSRNQRLGESCYNDLEKINAELFTLTYGALVAQLVRDMEDVDKVNAKLDEMGHNIGLRLIDELLAKSGIARCGSFRETADVVSKVGFKMFLNTVPNVDNWNERGTECTLVFDDNPLEDFVALPSSCAGLKYSNVLCGVLRGALESVHLAVACEIVSDALKGDPKTEIRMSLKHVIEDEAGEDYRED